LTPMHLPPVLATCDAVLVELRQMLNQRIARRHRRTVALSTRPLDAGPYTFIAADALVREGGRVINVHALLATGVNADEHREILGLEVTSGEDGAGWPACFTPPPWIRPAVLRPRQKRGGTATSVYERPSWFNSGSTASRTEIACVLAGRAPSRPKTWSERGTAGFVPRSGSLRTALTRDHRGHPRAGRPGRQPQAQGHCGRTPRQPGCRGLQGPQRRRAVLQPHEELARPDQQVRQARRRRSRQRHPRCESWTGSDDYRDRAPSLYLSSEP
jgi:hypothetical protein